MSESASEIFGDGVMVNGLDLTWFHVFNEGDRIAYTLVDDEQAFGISE